MTIRYHTPHPVKKCLICQHSMEMGKRVYITMTWEQGNRRDKRKSSAGFICQNCGKGLAQIMGLETFEYKE